MKIVLKKNNTTLLHAVFLLWLFCEIMFEHTIISQGALMLFVGVAILLTGRPSWSIHLFGYGLFIAWSALNIYFGYATSTSTASAMTRTLVLNLLFLYAFICYCRYIKDIRTVLKFYTWIALLFSIPCMLGGLGTVLQGERLSILGINANRIATMMAYSIIILFYTLLNSEDSKLRRRNWILIAWLAMVILLTGSRKGLLIPMVGVYVLICARRPRKILKYSAVIAAVGGVVLLMILNIEPLYNLIGHRVEAVLQYLSQDSYTEASLMTRDSYVALGWEMSQYEPVWGYGLDCFRLLRKSYGTYSHNNYIEILYSLGWVGLIVYYCPFVLTLFRLLKNWKKHTELVSFMLALIAPFMICDYMNVTYFERMFLLIPAIVMIAMGKKGLENEAEKIS